MKYIPANSHKFLLICSLILLTFPVSSAKAYSVVLGDTTTDNGKFDADASIELKSSKSGVKVIKYRLLSTDTWKTYSKKFTPKSGTYSMDWKTYDSNNKLLKSGVEKFQVKSTSTAYLTDLTTKAGNSPRSITLSWKNTKNSKVNSIKVYRHIQKSYSVSSTYYLKTLAKDAVKFVDTKDLVKNKTYYYKILFLDKSGNELGNYATSMKV